MKPRPALIKITMLLSFSSLAPLGAEEKKTAAPVREESITRTYHIPATFVISRESTGKTTSDPFAERNTEAGSGAEQTLRMTFLKAGVELNTDDTIVHNAANETLVVRTSLSANSQLEEYFALLKSEAERQIHILLEYIEVDHLDFSDWMLENRLAGDGTPLRKEVQNWVRQEKATILDSVMVTARSGQRAKVESIHELFYPTEFTPPQMPNTLTQADDAPSPIGPLTCTAFECRNVGITLEVDPVLGADSTTIDLNLAPEIVQLEGYTSWPSDVMDPLFRADLPKFYTMKTTTQITTLDGRYGILSTLRPLNPSDPKRKDALVLVFVRADVGSLGEWSVEESK